jgi:hypothetical protein
MAFDKTKASAWFNALAVAATYWIVLTFFAELHRAVELRCERRDTLWGGADNDLQSHVH